MYVDNTSCCAIGDINGLEDYVNRPKQAMLAFLTRLAPSTSWQPIKNIDLNQFIDAHYLFSGVEKVTEAVLDEYDEYYEEDSVPTGYAEQFAKYIQEHKLGRVVRTSAKPNRLNHPEHIVRGYLWTPDIDALTKWYKANHK